MKQSIYRFKDGGRREYAEFYAKESARLYGDWIKRKDIQAIIPIPIHRHKRYKRGYNCNLLEYLTQRDIQTKNSGVNVRYRGKHRFFKGFNEFIKEKTRRCDNDFEKIERHVFF